MGAFHVIWSETSNGLSGQLTLTGGPGSVMIEKYHSKINNSLEFLRYRPTYHCVMLHTVYIYL